MVYDCIVIGGGPGGLSSAIYLGRANKKVLLIYSGPMRTSLSVHINNYVGFDNITGPDLLEAGMEQAKKYGVEVVLSTVRDVSKEDVFKVVTSEGIFQSRYIVAASGINDILPDIDNISDFLGETFFTCLDCDGYRMTGKRAIIIGNGDGVARTALAVKQIYTDKITVCTGKDNKISVEYMDKMRAEKIKVVNKGVKHLNGTVPCCITSVVLEDDSEIECDCVLSDMGYARNDSFLMGLDLKRSKAGFIEVDGNYESSVKGLFAVGPLNTGPDQVSVAVGQGAVAAMHIIESDFDLEA
jgi:thioredoxin reductase (NADPH)